MNSDKAETERARAFYDSYELPRTPTGESTTFDEALTSHWMAARFRIWEAFAKAANE